VSADGAARLRSLLAEPGRVHHAPGCFDAVTARLARAAGFKVVHLSGAVVSATVLGLPDLGFAAATDMVEAATRIATASDLPLVADADTGYGNPVHVQETVRRYAAAGVAGLHLEDQVLPKRCGHMADKQLVPMEDMAAKVAAAAEVPDRPVLVARTDAATVEGLPAAVMRAQRYAEAGADLLFVEGVTAEDDLRAVVHGLVEAGCGDVGLVVNRSEAAGEVALPREDILAELGVRLVLHPVAALLAALRAAREVYAALAADTALPPRATWAELTGLLELPALLAVEAHWAAATDS
jgi:2,3-dimethylmalate lyase